MVRRAKKQAETAERFSMAAEQLRIAAEQLRIAAEAGDPAAMWQYALSRLNLRSPVAGTDNQLPFLVRVANTLDVFGDHQASDLISRAAEAGHPQATVVIAVLEEKTDPAASERLVTPAANQGDAAAMRYLALLLEKHDRAGAMQWFARLAGLGDDSAMYRLSHLLRTEGNEEAAQGWLVKAAQSGNRRAESDLAVQAFEGGDTTLDRKHPPATDPRRTSLYNPRFSCLQHERRVAHRVKCEAKTVQDHFQLPVHYGTTSSGKPGLIYAHYSAVRHAAACSPWTT